jgi:succinoglycan biosynthesis protein ExoA
MYLQTSQCGDLAVAEGTGLLVNENKIVRVSVVVPCRNEVRHIRAFLDCLLRQDLGHIEMEVLIADGMSIDGTRKILREFEGRFPSIRILDNPEKIASTGMNRAIREARGEVILRMDAHTVYAPDYVRSCVLVLQETNADNVGGPALTRAGGYIGQAIAFGFHAPFATGGAKFRDPRYEGPVSSVPYGCWRKATLEFFGLFDSELVRGQDDELNFRIVSAGGTVWQTPRIVSWYRPRKTLSALFRQFFRNGFWKVAILRKHGRPPSWRNLAPATCLLLGIVLPLGAAATNVAGPTGWKSAFLAAWFSLATLYLVASVASAYSIARRNGWIFFPILPVVFATYQLAYALGFLVGIFCRPVTPDRPNPVRKVLTAISK